MVLDMKVIGKMICSMDMEKKFGQIIANMKENIMMERNMEEDCMCGPMEACMMVTGMKIELRGMELILG
jgi:hypothetical protein